MGVSEKPYSGQMDAEKWVVAVVPPWRDLKPVFTKPVDSKAEKQEEELSTTPTSEESRIPTHASLKLYAYSDADWAGDPTDRHSTTGRLKELVS
ncbi:hypothetical protein RJ640_026659 [Escallonia rubra]|uniref:Uncharacterized protein n=1 Tax=Escallonia rubra TaxID=112253 RepID=A0AA88QNB2_9ASTE|nr:hypothetical protein RJ640_026659 [Escallonia rubra]